MTESEYILSLIDETFAEVPQVKAHHERMRAIAKRLEEMANGLTQAETEATPSCAGLTVKPWTPWNGGPCPVQGGETVEVRTAQFNQTNCIGFARNMRWNWIDDGRWCDIVAYRVL